MEKKLVTRLLIVINFIAIFIDPFTATLDLNTFRLLSFSVINTFSFIYIYTVPDLSKLLFKALKTKISILILCFISWGLLSSLYADNVNQVFLRSFSFFNFYFSFLILYVLIAFNKFKEYQIGYFMCLVVLAQLASSYNSFIQITNLTQYNFSYNVFLNGFFPNRNITAAVYLYQLPFLIYILSYRPVIIDRAAILRKSRDFVRGVSRGTQHSLGGGLRWVFSKTSMLTQRSIDPAYA